MATLNHNNKRPEAVQLYQMFQNLKDKTYGQALTKRQEWHQQLYDGKYDLGLDSNNFSNPVIPPTGRLVVEAPVNYIAMDNLVVTQEAKPTRGRSTTSKKADTLADKREKFLNNLLQLWQRKEPYHLREGVKQLALRGECFRKLHVPAELLKDPNTYEKNPIDLTVPDALTIFAPLTQRGYGPPIVFEEKIIYLDDLMMDVANWNEGDWKEPPVWLAKLNSTDMVRLTEWWTAKWRGFMVASNTRGDWAAVPYQGEDAYPNVLAFVPYFRSFSGLGHSPWDGDPAHLIVGILTGLEGTLKGEARNRTKIDTITSKFALPIPVLTRDEEYTPTGADKDWAAGVIKEEIKGRTEWRYLMPPPIPTDLLQEAQVFKEILEEFLPAVTMGVGQSGESAISAAQRHGRALLKWQGMFQATRHSLAEVLGKVLEIIDTVIKAPVTLGGLTLTPDDIQGYYQVNVDIEPGNPEELWRDKLMGMQLWEKLDQETIYQEYFHYPNATEMVTKFWANKFLQSPQAQQYVMQEAMKERGMRLEVEALEAEAAERRKQVGGSATIPTEGEQVPGLGGSPAMGVTGLPQPQTSPETLAMRRMQEATR